jgi:hypothetical protein
MDSSFNPAPFSLNNTFKFSLYLWEQGEAFEYGDYTYSKFA